MFTDKLLVFLEILVIRLCFTQELSSFGAVGNAPAGALHCGPVCSAQPSPHARANWWPRYFASLMFTVAHSSLVNERPLRQAALSSLISGFVFSA